MGNMRERHEKMLDLLAACPVCTVVELSETLSVTAETIRKDLDTLERLGKVTRIHGGAALRERQGAVVPYSTRALLHGKEKRQVATAAASLVAQGDSLLLEASTTTAHLCQVLLQNAELCKTLTVFSNSVLVAQTFQMGALCQRFFLLGGWLRRTEGAAYGAFALTQMEALHVDKAFLSGAALNPALELGAYDEADLGFQQTAMRRADQSILMLDSGKYPSAGLYRVCDAQDFDYFVTNAALPDAALETLRQTPCKLLPVR